MLLFRFCLIIYFVSHFVCRMRSGFRDETSACKCVNSYKPAQQERSSRMGWPSEKGTGQTRGIGRAKGRDCLSVVSGIYRIVDRFLLFLSLSLFIVGVVASVFFSREQKKILKKVVAISCLFFCFEFFNLIRFFSFFFKSHRIPKEPTINSLKLLFEEGRGLCMCLCVCVRVSPIRAPGASQFTSKWFHHVKITSPRS